MSNFFKKLVQENNLIIFIPAVFVILIIVALMIYGFTDPKRTQVETLETLLDRQVVLEEELLEEYSEKNYTQYVPYIKVNPYEISPLSAIMMFNTEEEDNFKLVVKGRTADADWEFITPLATSHMIPVLGLYNGINNIELYDYDDENDEVGILVYSTDVTIVSDIVGDKLIAPTSIETTYDYFGDDLMMLTPAANNAPIGYDFNGDIRWYCNEPLGFTGKFLENGHMMIGTNRIISDPYYTSGLFEMDLLGKIYKEYYIPGGYHHDFVELESGNILVLSSDFMGTVEDLVVEIERSSGLVVNSWDIADYVSMFDGTAEMWTTDDWFHNNSIDYDGVTDSIILSGRHQDAVISIGYTSKELNWIIGNPENWDAQVVNDYFFTPVGENFEWQYAQHSAIVLPNGDIFIFDNGNNKAKNSENYVLAQDSYSRGVIYDIDTDVMEITQVFEYGKDLGSDFYSPYISNVAYYDDGHYMIHSGGISSSSIEGPLNIPAPLYKGEGVVSMNSITVELLNDVVEYQLEVPSNYYRANRIAPYNVTTSFSLGVPEILGKQSRTPVYTEEVEEKFTVFHDVPLHYELSMVKETDRLVVEGVFDRYDTIYLILEGEYETYTYHIPTSRTAYTAMCTAVFQDDSRFLTYYINEFGLLGRFDVFININGHKYNTYKEVEFN